MNVMVTGATGYIGSNLAHELVTQGKVVHILVRNTHRVSALRKRNAGVRVHVYDGSYESVRNAFDLARPDAVFHLASNVVVAHNSNDIDEMMNSNIRFGALVAEAACDSHCRAFINAGTSWQYYRGVTYSPVNLYAATKQAFEDILRFYHEARELHVVNLVLFDTYGPGDTRHKLIPQVIDSLGSSTALELSRGEQQLDLVYVDDTVAAFLRGAEIALSDETAFGSFAVTSGRSISLREVVRVIENVSGRTANVRFGAKRYRDREVMTPWKTGTILPGWSANVCLEDGIRRVLCA